MALPATARSWRSIRAAKSGRAGRAPAHGARGVELRPRDIVTPEAIDTPLPRHGDGRLDEHVLHTLALAREAGVDYPIARLNEVAERVPNICKVRPRRRITSRMWNGPAASRHPMELFKRPASHGDAMTSPARRCSKRAGRGEPGSAVIRPLSNPYSERGGLAILFGNLAPEGGAVKAGHPAGDDASSRPGVVFDSHDEANAASSTAR